MKYSLMIFHMCLIVLGFSNLTKCVLKINDADTSKFQPGGSELSDFSSSQKSTAAPVTGYCHDSISQCPRWPAFQPSACETRFTWETLGLMKLDIKLQVKVSNISQQMSYRERQIHIEDPHCTHYFLKVSIFWEL